MQYADYVARMQRAAALADQGDLDGAVSAFLAIVEADISDLDKANICLNLAVLTARQQRTEQALGMHDLAIRFEAPHSRYSARERKAAYLHSLGRTAEATFSWRDPRPFLADLRWSLRRG